MVGVPAVVGVLDDSGAGAASRPVRGVLVFAKRGPWFFSKLRFMLGALCGAGLVGRMSRVSWTTVEQVGTASSVLWNIAGACRSGAILRLAR